MSTTDEAVAAMQSRGLNNVDDLLSFATPDRIVGACRWWDGKRGAGTGVLAQAIRRGGMDEPSEQRDLLAEQKYADSIVAWLRQHFPQFDRPVYGPHPAAVAAVIRLHWLHGKGQLTVQEHGPEIRAAVARWEEEWE